MRIKQAAARLNLSARTIRFYEEKGLIRPGKDPDNHYRVFTEQDISRLKTIVALRESGMTVEEVRIALDRLEELGPAELLSHLEQQRSLMMARWMEMKRALDTTDQMIDLLKAHSEEPREQVYELADESRSRREQTRKWKDIWNFDQLASSHDERVAQGSGPYADYDRTLLAMADMIEPSAGERGLDIGTGTGNLAGLLMERGARMSGLDQSRKMLGICRNKLPGMETRLGNFLALPFADREFDFVVSSFAFHHLTGRQQEIALEEMRRVAKPAGRICIAGPVDQPSSCASRTQGQARTPADPDKQPPSSSADLLVSWLEARHYKVTLRQIRPSLHVVLGEPQGQHAP